MLPHVEHPLIRVAIIILAAGMVTFIFFEFDSFFGFAPFGTNGVYGYNGPFTNIPFYTVYILAIIGIGLLDLTTRTGQEVKVENRRGD